MEVEKLFKIGVKYLSDYLGVLFSTVRSPILEYQPVETPIESSIISPKLESKAVKTRPNPKLLIFLFISIFIGSVLNSNIPGRNAAPSIGTTMIIVFACWLLFSSLVHIICRLFAGCGSLMQTLSINLQVLAVTYVLSGCASFLWGIVAGKIPTYLQTLIGKTFINEPINFYFIIQLVLLFIYLPWANRRVHKFSFARLRRRIPKRTFSAAFSIAEAVSFYLVFLAVTLVIVGFSKTNYEVHNFPLNENMIGNDPKIGPEDSFGLYQSKVTKDIGRRYSARPNVINGNIHSEQEGNKNPDEGSATSQPTITVIQQPSTTSLEHASGRTTSPSSCGERTPPIESNEQASARTPYIIDKDGNARGYPGVQGW